MAKVLVDFDAISYREHLKKLRNKAELKYLQQQGTFKGMSFESMQNAFEMALNAMEDYATFEERNDDLV